MFENVLCDASKEEALFEATPRGASSFLRLCAKFVNVLVFHLRVANGVRSA